MGMGGRAAAAAKKAFYFAKLGTRVVSFLTPPLTLATDPRSRSCERASEKGSKLGVARVLLAPARDGLAGHDVLDELLARQPRAYGVHPTVTSQHSSTALYQVFYHIWWLFFESDNRI